MQAITQGFSEPVHQAQQVFRRVLDAMARPGHIHTLAGLPPAAPGLSPAATAVCLSLADFETPLWLDPQAAGARDHLVFHCSAPVTDTPRQAMFAAIAMPRQLTDFTLFNPGSDEYPETSTTLIVEVTGLGNQGGQALAGPGIPRTTQLQVDGVAQNFWQQVRENHALFPRGVDLILTCNEQIAALPRSVRALES